ncbi:MAG: SAM-dependent methyltransferase [Candidatus Nanopelagicaceae bacterium]|nr:SAM-dependent methyltransferase [Candidatus Nanopelagicaceae bacterium]
MSLEEFQSIQEWISGVDSLKRAIISGRRKSHNPRYERIDIRPVKIKEQLLLQFVFHDGKQDLTKNLLPSELDIPALLNEGYANILIERVDETLTIRVTKQGALQIHRAKSDEVKEVEVDHDRKKERALPITDEIFKALGIASLSGELIPRQADKYRQVDDFLKIIESSLDQLAEKNIDVVDLGCGNAYLTFAVHRFLSLKGKDVRVVGVDNKPESRARNAGIAKELGIANQIEFIASDIAKYLVKKTTLVIALHACDTATDDALAWAIKSEAKVILVSPCCHHDLNKRIKPAGNEWEPLFRNGIVKERFADLLTDSLRAELLRINGYKADIVEFVSIDHTPRNLMIRATFSGIAADRRNYESLCEQWSINPYLATLLT